ncbi:hypothetical protein K458DRAFT_395642 [Lentithecium fluviatile CBS 122367]|uniref:Uncharacterized protein n=1 Tax=Lentithecium fluviatile CBS 122367 TaxID=1168545 RepID=A0A6G1IIE6_9PLEO|nr:hypothetical protein K458DRAFT_395642 [Lentithecium fluviatile CBS 122367]
MDPLTAVSLAANIVQFVEFSCKLVTSSGDFLQSTTGRLPEHDEVNLIAESLKSLHEKTVCLSTVSLDLGRLNKHEKRLLPLREACLKVADELIDILEGLRVSGSQKRWKSVRAALLSTLKEKRVRELESRLLKLQAQIDSRVIEDIRKQQSEILQLLRKQTRLGGTSLQVTRNLSSLVDTVQSTFDGLRSRLDLVDVADRVNQAHTKALEQSILISLDYDLRISRRQAIKPAYPDTFRWIFEDQNASGEPITFVKWLQNKSGVYWITGKPGSGKSTLMKCIWSQYDTQQGLKKWSQGETVITAWFFFWNSGTAMQKSLEGLLRSMLIQILDQCPELIPEAFSLRWEALLATRSYATTQPLWSLQELLDSFRTITKQASMKAKFCFFIDGLDEYEGTDKELVEIIDSFNSSENLKFCLSSRPHASFRKAYGDDPRTVLHVPKLTDGDIRLYVRISLDENTAFQDMKKRYPDRCKQLVEGIVNDANGVFLWVHLVVSRLLDGIEINKDRMGDLERKFRCIPKELDDLFCHIMESVDHDYHELQANMFRVACDAEEPLDLMAYYFMDSEDTDSALKMPVEPLAFDVVREKQETMAVRVSVRSKGLLEVFEDPMSHHFRSLKVQLLHRTFRDFILDKHMQDFIRRRSAPNLNPLRSICLALLAELKTYLFHHHDPVRTCHQLRLLDSLLHYALEMELTEGASPNDVLAEARSILPELPRLPRGDHRHLYEEWLLFKDLVGDSESKSTSSDPFVEFATCRGLAHFPLSCMEQSKPTGARLDEILWASVQRRKISDHEPVLNPDVVKMLLDMGADPGPGWNSFLSSDWWALGGADVEKALFYVTKLFLEYNVHVSDPSMIRAKIVGFSRGDIEEIDWLIQTHSSRPKAAFQRLPFKWKRWASNLTRW